MKTRWTQSGEKRALEKWSGRYGEGLALRLYTARLIGEDPSLVLHGGGNVSCKGSHTTVTGDVVDAMFIKASGANLASLEPADLPALDLQPLLRLRELPSLDDVAMLNELRRQRFDTRHPTPSIETLLHAFLPWTYIDHSHADAVLAFACQPDGEKRLVDVLGDDVPIIPYVRPGFDLAKAVAAAVEASPKARAVVLLHHGLVTFADDARTCYETHIEMVSTCETAIADRSRQYKLPCRWKAPDTSKTLIEKIAPVLRGQLAEPTGDEDRPLRPAILEWRATDEVLQFVNSEQAGKLASTPPVTTDHIVRTKPWALFVEDPDWSNDDAWPGRLEKAVEAFRRDYRSYVTANGELADWVEASPRVVLLPGVGALSWGPTKRDALIAADITEHGIRTKLWADAIGSYAPLSSNHLYDMEFHAMQRQKVRAGLERPLDGRVVVISGGAGAIGLAIAQACAQAGAHIAITDLEQQRLDGALQKLTADAGEGAAIGVTMDVTDEESVRDAYRRIVRAFGGVDVIVPNAGIAVSASIQQTTAEEFRRVMEVNAVGYLIFMREGIRLLQAQGIGGHIIINASKNVFAPGKDFAAYSASKAAGHQLGKVAAIELAPSGIRVNMINADAVFDGGGIESGLWKTVGPARAASRGLEFDDLPEFYRQRNLLKVRVHGRHIGSAVVFFASNTTPTTGATLPIDGGIAEAFPR